MTAEFKRELAAILRRLCKLGKSILAVSHDVEFCAEYSDRCMLFFDGSVAAEGEPHEFFTGNSFYTTAANRMSRGICDAVTADELIYICGGEPAPSENFHRKRRAIYVYRLYRIWTQPHQPKNYRHWQIRATFS